MYIYNDEDNAPMNDDFGRLPYPVRTWEEMLDAWEGRNEQESEA